MDALGNQMRGATAILGAQRGDWDPEPSFERPQPPGTTASPRSSSPTEGGRLAGLANSDRWLAGWLAEIFFT